MRKIWEKHSYTIILLGLSLIFTMILAKEPANINEEDYVAIKIEEGETLTSIFNEYREELHLSSEEFIAWVKEANGVDDFIYAGETLIIPVEKTKIANSRFAVAENEFQQMNE